MRDILDQVARGTKSLRVIDSPHFEVHEGETYETSYKTPDGSDLADNATVLLMVAVGALPAHVTWIASCGGDAEVEMFEGVAASANGTALGQINMNRTSIRVRTVLTYLTPTVTNFGMRLINYLIAGGTGGQTAGGTARAETEWIFKPNTNYLFRLTNRAGTAQPASIIVQWYEHESDD